jgi:agmatinase
MEDRTLVDLDQGRGFRIPDPLPLVDVGDADVFPLDVMATTRSVSLEVQRIVERGALPITLGGDHYLAYPCFEGAARAIGAREPNASIGYLHIDSHTDLFDTLSFAGRYNHATAARRIVEHPKASRANMAWMGLNGRLVSIEQLGFVRRNDLLLVTSEDLLNDTWRESVDQALNRVSRADWVYVSIDIDVVDGSVAPGTGATVFEGITAKRFLAIAEAIGELPKLLGVDCCEVSPQLDPSGRTSRLAALALVSLIGARLFEPVDLKAAGSASAG